MTEDPNALPPKTPADEPSHEEPTPPATPPAEVPTSEPSSEPASEPSSESAAEPSSDTPPSDEPPSAPLPATTPSGAPPLVLHWAVPDDVPPPRPRVDPEDIRKALEEQAKKRPPRPPVNELLPPIPKLKVDKPRFRKHKP